jgi:hypothetical protein
LPATLAIEGLTGALVLRPQPPAGSLVIDGGAAKLRTTITPGAGALEIVGAAPPQTQAPSVNGMVVTLEVDRGPAARSASSASAHVINEAGSTGAAVINEVAV